jgi:tRNA(adenine34) deaminase
MIEDEKWMNLALEEARKAEKKGEVPVGAILVKNGLLLAQAHNEPISRNDPTAHAEIQLIRAAGVKLKNYRLNGTSLYVTLEPCAMCLGAMIHARIYRIVFGASASKTGTCESCNDINNGNFANHKFSITGKILEKECSELLQSFFKHRR